MAINLSGLGGGGVKSVQRGTTSLNSVATNTATISAVNLTKSVLIMTCTTNSASVLASLARGQITNSTTLTFTKGSSGANTIVEWQVVEYN